MGKSTREGGGGEDDSSDKPTPFGSTLDKVQDDLSYLFEMDAGDEDGTALPGSRQPKLASIKTPGSVHYVSTKGQLDGIDLGREDDVMFYLSGVDKKRPLYCFVARLPGTQGAWLPHLSLFDTGEIQEEELRESGYTAAKFQPNTGTTPSIQSPHFSTARFDFNFGDIQSLVEMWPWVHNRSKAVKEQPSLRTAFELDDEGKGKINIMFDDRSGEVSLALVRPSSTASGAVTDGYPYYITLRELARLVDLADAVSQLIPIFGSPTLSFSDLLRPLSSFIRSNAHQPSYCQGIY